MNTALSPPSNTFKETLKYLAFLAARRCATGTIGYNPLIFIP